jgi:hypothetical protein
MAGLIAAQSGNLDLATRVAAVVVTRVGAERPWLSEIS